MSTKIHQIILLSFSLCAAGQLSHAAVLPTVSEQKSKVNAVQITAENPSFIAKAAEKKHLLDGNNTHNLQMFASIQATPSQNFLAEQNQRFTRFIQALFG